MVSTSGSKIFASITSTGSVVLPVLLARGSDIWTGRSVASDCGLQSSHKEANIDLDALTE